MTEEEKLLNLWKKLCLRNRTTPVALITVDKEGFPHVLTRHSPETMQAVFRHLIESGPKSTTRHEENEN